MMRHRVQWKADERDERMGGDRVEKSQKKRWVSPQKIDRCRGCGVRLTDANSDSQNRYCYDCRSRYAPMENPATDGL
ncbi:hypothetical protein [Lyngbya sp. CCY1209]|uniref:hypothetical protein n=1 Tax=Lyngbya sp. CCY1209 TaxID=2886103 RepID=UPI002D2024FD|nr:hypothetical protein [Lyngbya sp. CCY1209]MEB3884020.1 hypothetical protein [Lyngbya sp. CCY1209]